MKYRYIDAIRGIAILAVLCVHTQQYGSGLLPEILKSFLIQGGRGVQLFFVASAFTLFLTYGQRDGKEVFLNSNFFLRRFLRIAPMYYIGICYFLWQNGNEHNTWLGDETGFSVGNIISNFFFVHGVNPKWITSLVPGGWSITVEMTFYLLVPLLFKLITSLNRAILFTIIAFLSSFLLSFLFLKYPVIQDSSLWKTFLFLYFPSQFPVFGIGIIAYFIIVKKDWIINPNIILIICLAFLIQFIWGWIDLRILFSISFLPLLIGISRFGKMFLVNNIFCYVGKVSYSAYLVHFGVLYWLRRLNFTDYVNDSSSIGPTVNFAIRLVLVIVFTVAISTLFYRIIELPFINLGKKIIARRELKAVSA